MHLLGILHLSAAVLGFDDLLVRAAAVVLALSAAWLGIVAVALLLEAATSGHLKLARFTGAPAPLQRALLAGAVGALALLGLGPPAQAGAGRPVGDPDRRALGATAALEGLPLPDRTLGSAEHTITVRPGDSLWRIAGRLLPGADDVELVAAMRSLHTHNRGILGPDPDLLHPGQRLRLPDTLTTTTQEHA